MLKIISRSVSVLLLAGLPVMTGQAQAKTVDSKSLDAKTFRWAFQSDAGTMDPHGLAETMTLSFQGNIYEGLVRRDANMKLVAALAERWENTSANVWRFHLRRGVKFHNGNAFKSDDVKFSVERANSKTSGMRGAASVLGKVKIIDDHTVDIITPRPNPILPFQIELVYIMDRQWTEQHNAVAVSGGGQDKTTNYAHLNANGTGPFKLHERQPGTKTVLMRNAAYWGASSSSGNSSSVTSSRAGSSNANAGNIARAVFTPVANDATRVAALLSGNVHMAYPVPVQDWQRLRTAKGVRPLTGPEARTIFLGFDQHRDELKASNIKGRNPFKDVRVRKAFLHAINIDAIKTKVMRNAAVPAGLMVAPGINGFSKALNQRARFDVARARDLLAEAGYKDGFDLAMDCPNNRYVNDEKICQAVATMLAKIDVRVKLLAQPKAKFFAKILGHNGYDTSFFLLGWTPSTFDSHNPIAALMSCRGRGDKLGLYNIGGYCNPRINDLAVRIQAERDQTRRRAMIEEAFRIHKNEVGHIPLHQQPLSWGVADSVEVVQRPDNIFALRYVRMR